jgi:mannose-6-phosphate isomerase-like protein (cupin superfamily)
MRPGETIEAPIMGMRVTCRESAASSGGELLSFDFWMRGGATPPPMHVHPHQEERITVISGSVRSRSAVANRVLSPGDTVVSPPGESHTVGPAGNEDVEMIAELRPALAYEQFMERSFALDRAGHVNAKGRGNPLRMATARPHEAEFSCPASQSGCSEPCSAYWTGSADGSPARATDEEQGPVEAAVLPRSSTHSRCARQAKPSNCSFVVDKRSLRQPPADPRTGRAASV